MTDPQAPHTPQETVYARMGRLLDLDIRSEVDALRAVTVGIASRSFLRVERKLGLDAGSVAAPSTIRRRLAQKSRLNHDESERLLRLIRAYSQAVELFGDEPAAMAWLKTPADFLHDEAPITPLKLAESDSGARLVESYLRRTAYGFL